MDGTWARGHRRPARTPVMCSPGMSTTLPPGGRAPQRSLSKVHSKGKIGHWTNQSSASTCGDVNVQTEKRGLRAGSGSWETPEATADTARSGFGLDTARVHIPYGVAGLLGTVESRRGNPRPDPPSLPLTTIPCIEIV